MFSCSGGKLRLWPASLLAGWLPAFESSQNVCAMIGSLVCNEEDCMSSKGGKGGGVVPGLTMHSKKLCILKILPATGTIVGSTMETPPVKSLRKESIRPASAAGDRGAASDSPAVHGVRDGPHLPAQPGGRPGAQHGRLRPLLRGGARHRRLHHHRRRRLAERGRYLHHHPAAAGGCGRIVGFGRQSQGGPLNPLCSTRIFILPR